LPPSLHSDLVIPTALALSIATTTAIATAN
jgi:hypothetical protein